MDVSREEKLGKGPILKTMLQMGIPVFIAQLINLLYSIVDRIYIGHISGTGAMALTGVGVCFPIITLITAFSNFVSGGGTPQAGIALGRGDRDKAEKILGNGLSMIIIMSIALTLLFEIIKRPFLYMFGASDATYIYAKPYITIYLLGTLFSMITMGLNNFITVQGQATKAMLSVVIGALANLILDPIFIFAFNMGVSGAAIATIISQAISALWIMSFLLSEKATVRLKLTNLKPDKEIIKNILSLGISPFIMGATESLITVTFNYGAKTYGNDLYVGSITILQSVMQIIFAPMNGFTQGVQPIISYNYGAGNTERVKKTAFTQIAITGSFSFVLTGLCMLFPGTVAGIFTDDGDLLSICVKVMPIFMAGMLVFGLQSGCQSAFMGLSRVKESLFFALLRKVILLTPLAIILPKAMNSVMGIYYAEPISDTISALCCTLVFIWTIRKLQKGKLKA